MRLIVLKADSAQTLNTRLSGTPAGDPSSSLERLKLLNPHVDFGRLSAGTVLFLPDAPDIEAADSRTLDGGAFEAFASDLENGVQAAAARTRAGYERLSADRSEVGAVLKTAALKRLVESDGALKAQLDEVNAQFAKDQRDAQDAVKQLEAMQKEAAAEMAALGKLFG